MKKILFVIVTVLMLSTQVFAARTDKCIWIWSTDVTTANDAPDYVYCSLDGRDYLSQGTSYIQNSNNAESIDIVYDTTWNNSNTVPRIPDTITPCSNTAATGDLNVLMCTGTTCSTGTGTVAYVQTDNIADNIVNGYSMTPVESFKLTVDGDTATCWVVYTTVSWR